VRSRYIELKHLKDELERNLKDKRTALSICADSCEAFKPRYNEGSRLFELDGLIEDIKVVDEMTDMVHVDLMEISLEDEGSVAAGKKVLDTVMRI
jgi:hypothetical protein